MEFEKFERQFKECISSAAIQTKFEQHHKQGMTVVAELERLLETEEQQVHENRLDLSVWSLTCLLALYPFLPQ